MQNGINGVRSQAVKFFSQFQDIFADFVRLNEASDGFAIPFFFAGNFPNALAADKSLDDPCRLRRWDVCSGFFGGFWRVLAGSRGFPCVGHLDATPVEKTKLQSRRPICPVVHRRTFSRHPKTLSPRASSLSN